MSISPISLKKICSRSRLYWRRIFDFSSRRNDKCWTCALCGSKCRAADLVTLRTIFEGEETTIGDTQTVCKGKCKKEIVENSVLIIESTFQPERGK